jgi:amphi-Trp domain-containing protein
MDIDGVAARPGRPPPGTRIGEALVMPDVKVERKESLSRDEAAQLLALLSKAFTTGDHAELPFGPSSVSLKIPDRVRTELEVEVEGDEVEVEVEFKWSLSEHEAGTAMGEMTPPPGEATRGNGARKPTRSRAPKTQKR